MPTSETSITVESASDDNKYARQRIERENESAAARVQFVAMIRDENFYSDYSKWSLKQHRSGARGGFANEQLQKRWRDFEAGWKAAKGIQ